MAPTTASLVDRLEQMKRVYGKGAATAAATLLNQLEVSSINDAETLIRCHDALLFLRAFPQSMEVVRKCDDLLSKILPQITCLRDRSSDMDVFDPEDVCGIAGTTIEQDFTYEVAQWLSKRHSNDIGIDWDEEEQGLKLGATLPRFLPLFEDDVFVEPDTPYLEWIRAATGGENHDFAWLMRRFGQLPMTETQTTELYDALGVRLRWDLGNAPGSRTNARLPVDHIFCHDSPLIVRNQVSLAAEFAAPPLHIRKLPPKEADEVLDAARYALTVRARELYGSTRGDANSVFAADVGRGVTIYMWGLPPDRRMPLRAYHCGFTVKNGVPVNYLEGISLFEWMEVGFNTFYAYREGETAWIYSKVLKFFHQHTGVKCISVYPYQLGQDNEEAIASGAFWFYRKLGFRPGRPDLLAITEKEEKKIGTRKGYRTSARTLRKLAEGHVFFEIGNQPIGLWDTFSTRKLGIAVQHRMAEEFGGDSSRMRRGASAALAQALEAELGGWNELERNAFENFSVALSLAPEVTRWSKEDRRSALEVIRAKVAPDERDYLRLMQSHEGMKQALRRAGSAAETARAATA